MKIGQLIASGVLLSALAMMVGCEQQGPAERAGEKIDEAVEDGKNDVEDAVEKAGEALENAGDEIREKTQ